MPSEQDILWKKPKKKIKLSGLKEKRKKKAFIMYHNIDDEFVELIVVEKCPVCGHVFTEEEYDELTFW